MSRVLTVGETMALLDPVGDGPLALERTLTLRVGGAESNFAIALARLEVPVTWVSRLGADPLGDVVAAAIAGEGVEVRARREPDAPTAVFFKWREAGRTGVLYYRRGSAASLLAPEDVPDALLEGVELVHLTGITMALSESARRLVVDVAARAAARGLTVLFDPNWRAALWPSPAAAAAAHAEVLPHVSWYLCGAGEGDLLWGTESVEQLATAIPVRSAIRVGERGAVVGGELVPPLRRHDVLDEVGAGDGFAAGFAFGLLRGLEPHECVRAANAVAAGALASTGDWETYPRLAELERELAG